MKIAFLSFYSGTVERGVEVWVKELSLRLNKEHKVFIYGDENNSPNGQSSLSALSRRFFIDDGSKKIYRFTKKILRNIKTDNVDIIIPTNGGWQSLLCKLYAKKYKKKVVIVGHSGVGWDDRINLLTRPDVFVALSNHQKQWAQKNGFGVRVEKIPDGVDTEKFTPLGEKIPLKLPKPVILVVSGLEKQKRVEMAIGAVAKLKKGSLVVLGQGNKLQTAKIQQIGISLLGHNFLLKTVPHQDILKWYRASDLVTFPSFEREAFGMVLLEAMSCNKPVVASDDPIRREIVGEGGLFCDPTDSDQYAQTLDRALSTNFGHRPRVQAEKFNWNFIVAQYNSLFKSL